MKITPVALALSLLLAAGASLPTTAVASGGRMKDAVKQDRQPDTKRDRSATQPRKGKFKSTEPSRTKDNWPRFK